MANYRISETAKAALDGFTVVAFVNMVKPRPIATMTLFLSVLSYWQSNPICTKLLMTFERDIDELFAVWTVSIIALTAIPLRS